MANRQLTFKQYVQGEGDNPPPVDFWWSGLNGRPHDLDTGQLLQGAGLTDIPLADLVTGYLEAPWQGHPRAALVISTGLGFVPGDRYAVSLEPATPLP